FEAAGSGFPHSPQNLIDGPFSKPQLGHLAFSDAPHSPQNFMPLAFSKPQAEQRIGGPRWATSTVDPPATGIQATGAPAASPSAVMEFPEQELLLLCENLPALSTRPRPRSATARRS